MMMPNLIGAEISVDTTLCCHECGRRVRHQQIVHDCCIAAWPTLPGGWSVMGGLAFCDQHGAVLMVGDSEYKIVKSEIGPPGRPNPWQEVATAYPPPSQGGLPR